MKMAPQIRVDAPARSTGRLPPLISHHLGMGHGCPHAQMMRYQLIPQLKLSCRDINERVWGDFHCHGLPAMNQWGGGEVSNI